MRDEELASGTNSAGHMLVSLWLEPLVSYVCQEFFLVPLPTPAYLLHLHTYNGVFLFLLFLQQLQFAMLGATLTSRASFVQG